jgi:hypothetical protein
VRDFADGFSMIAEEATAYHEAGHAVMGAIRNRPPTEVTIIPKGGVAGRTEFPKDWKAEFKRYLLDTPEKRDYIDTRVMTVLAGTIAHDLRCPGRKHDLGDARDEGGARDLIEQNACWAADCRDSYFQQLQETAHGSLQANWPWVEAVARTLLEGKTISGATVVSLRPNWPAER